MVVGRGRKILTLRRTTTTMTTTAHGLKRTVVGRRPSRTTKAGPFRRRAQPTQPTRVDRTLARLVRPYRPTPTLLRRRRRRRHHTFARCVRIARSSAPRRCCRRCYSHPRLPIYRHLAMEPISGNVFAAEYIIRERRRKVSRHRYLASSHPPHHCLHFSRARRNIW